MRKYFLDPLFIFSLLRTRSESVVPVECWYVFAIQVVTDELTPSVLVLFLFLCFFDRLHLTHSSRFKIIIQNLSCNICVIFHGPSKVTFWSDLTGGGFSFTVIDVENGIGEPRLNLGRNRLRKLNSNYSKTYLHINVLLYIGILQSSKFGVGNNSVRTNKLFKFIPGKELNVNKFTEQILFQEKKQYSVRLG